VLQTLTNLLGDVQDAARSVSPLTRPGGMSADDAATSGEGGGVANDATVVDSLKEREKKRLEQNREAAKRFRQKKKNHMAELEDAVAALRADNARLQADLAATRDQLGAAAGGGAGVLEEPLPAAILQVRASRESPARPPPFRCSANCEVSQRRSSVDAAGQQRGTTGGAGIQRVSGMAGAC
jgi:Basic region leucine zipper